MTEDDREDVAAQYAGHDPEGLYDSQDDELSAYANAPERSTDTVSMEELEAVDPDPFPGEVDLDMAEWPDVDDDAMGTPYTDEPLEYNEDDELAEPVPDETDAAVLPSHVTAFIRTITPLMVGWLLSAAVWAGDLLGLGTIPPGAEAWLAGAVPVVLSALYYVLAKWLEQRFPKVPWLGSTRRPLYTAPVSSKQPAVLALASSGFVWWRGGKFTPAFRDSLVEADKLAPGFVLTQGGFNGTKVSASAGTHAGDAADFSVKGKTKEQVAKFIETQRRVGNAASFRTTRVAKWGTRAHGFSAYHVHVVPNGYAAPSAAAKAQVSSWKNGIRAGYRHGRDGLASNQPDRGPGHTGAYRTRTWFDYKKTKTGSTPKAPYVVPSGKRVKEDGVLGPQTIRALQHDLYGKYGTRTIDGKRPLPADGILGRETYAAIQRVLQYRMPNTWAKWTCDGVFGSNWVKRLQWYVGARPLDGKWGRVTTLALQRKLNSGGF